MNEKTVVKQEDSKKPLRHICDKVELRVFFGDQVIRGEIPSSVMVEMFMKHGTLGVDTVCLALLSELGWNEIN